MPTGKVFCNVLVNSQKDEGSPLKIGYNPNKINYLCQFVNMPSLINWNNFYRERV
jgi:hypothetical protein